MFILSSVNFRDFYQFYNLYLTNKKILFKKNRLFFKISCKDLNVSQLTTFIFDPEVS